MTLQAQFIGFIVVLISRFTAPRMSEDRNQDDHLYFKQQRREKCLKRLSDEQTQDFQYTSFAPIEETPLVHAWRMYGFKGLVECLLHGPSHSFLYPTVIMNTSLDEHVLVLLPNPLLLAEKGNYMVHCTKLFDFGVGLDHRWPQPLHGPIILADHLQGKNNNSTSSRCVKVRKMLNAQKGGEIHRYLQSINVGECPGVIIETSTDPQHLERYLLSDQILDAPPSVIRVQHVPESLQRKGKCDFNAASLPICVNVNVPGRWLPIHLSRPLVNNGDSIPQDRSKYWVPYSCRPTYWNADLLLGEGASNRQCDVKALSRVVFTGSSTEAVLFSSFRQVLLKETTSKAKRVKERDHLKEQNKELLATTTLQGKNVNMRFDLFPMLMPLMYGRNTSEVYEEFQSQVQTLLSLKPTAIVLHVGLHEVCGAYGPQWWQQNRSHAPCATRRELKQAYHTYSELLDAAGYSGKVVFRTMMGTYPDVDPNPPWRWTGFADCGSHFMKRGQSRGGNPCPAVAAPVAHAAFMGDDARLEWAQYKGASVVDAYSVVHSSPTSNQAFPDGIHPQIFSDEALAVNQLILNTLCAPSQRTSEQIPPLLRPGPVLNERKSSSSMPDQELDVKGDDNFESELDWMG